MKTFRIKKGPKTANHGVTLKKLGFEVTEDATNIFVQANDVEGIDLPVDIRDDEGIKAFARHCRDNKQLANYSTPFLVKKKDGTEATLSSILACTALGSEFSALIAKPASSSTSKKSGPSIDDLDAPASGEEE